MVFNLIQLYALLILGVGLAGSCRTGLFRKIVSVFFSLILSLQLLSIMLSGKLIGYAFYYHANPRDIYTGLPQYPIEIGIFVVFIFVSFIIIAACSSPGRSSVAQCFLLVVLGGGVVSLPSGVVREIHDVLTITAARNLSFQENFVRLNGDFLSYIGPDKISSRPGKNIVVISLESLESGFLLNEMAELTPNLNSLRRQYNYYDMQQITGGGWTIGALYAMLTGLPAIFPANGNSVFKSLKGSNILGLGDVLRSAGYQSIFLIGDAEFAGTENLLTSQGFTVLSKLQLSKFVDIPTFWGMHDRQLFNAAKEEIGRLRNGHEPYAIFLSTVNTHAPNGVYDPNVTSSNAIGRDGIDHAVAALDSFVGDLINDLRTHSDLDDTVFFILPDHLMMGSNKIVRELNRTDRRLFIITNAELAEKKGSNFSQLDIPRLITEGAEINTTGKFLPDLLKLRPEAIKDNIGKISALNLSSFFWDGTEGWHSETKMEEGDVHEIRGKPTDKSRFIAHAGGSIDGLTYTNSLEALNNSYSQGFRYFELDILETSDEQLVAAHDWGQWARDTGFSKALPPTRSEFLKYKLHSNYTPLDMSLINEWFSFHRDAFLVTDKINKPKKVADAFIDRDRLLMELFTMNSVAEAFEEKIYQIIPNISVISRWKVRSDIEYLKSINVSHIAMSRRDLKSKKILLQLLLSNGITPYVYNINFDKGRDEKYVFCNEFGDVYGMYADRWSFPETIVCD